MARFIQGDRPEAGAELAMTGWKLARLFLGVALIFLRARYGGPHSRQNRGVLVAGIAAREGVIAKRSRREMAPQRLEKIESGPGNGRASEAWRPLYLVHGWDGLSSAARAESRTT